MAASARRLELLGSAVSYALAGVGMILPPPGLAAVLLPIAPLLISSGTRPGLFAAPVQLPGPACPGDQLVAFLGRQPRPHQASA